MIVLICLFFSPYKKHCYICCVYLLNIRLWISYCSNHSAGFLQWRVDAGIYSSWTCEISCSLSQTSEQTEEKEKHFVYFFTLNAPCATQMIFKNIQNMSNIYIRQCFGNHIHINKGASSLEKPFGDDGRLHHPQNPNNS